MPRDESWLNVNQIARLVTLPRLPNVIVVLPRVRVGATFIFHLPHGAAFANTRDTYIALLGRARLFFFFLPFPRAKKNLAPCFPRSCVRLLDHAGVTASWRSYLSVPTVQCVGDGSSSAGLTPSSPYASSARGVRESAESRAAVSTSPRTGCFELVSIHTHLPRRLLVIRSAAAPSSLFSGSD